MDIIKVVDSICETAIKTRCKFSENQRIVLVGALAVWLEKAKQEGANEMADAYIEHANRE